jgi:hypothetical protein
MTIEFSLRRRATKARYFAILWLGLAVAILVGTYFSLPSVAGLTINAVNNIEANTTGAGSIGSNDGASAEKKSSANLHLFALTTLVLGVFAIAFACYLLGKFAVMELESADRLRGIADAVCISGNDFAQLEKAADLLVPKGQSVSSNSKFVSTDDLKDLAEILQKLR